MATRGTLAAVFLISAILPLSAHIGESIEDVKARVDPKSITAQAQLPYHYSKLLWKRDDAVLANYQFKDGTADVEEFSKFDHTDLSDDEAKSLLREEPSPDKWKLTESHRDESVYTNEETHCVATYFSVKSPSVPGQDVVHFLMITLGREPMPQSQPNDRAKF